LPARSTIERAGIVGTLSALGIAVLFSPFKLCLMALVLRLPCPGCGMTRAAMALAQGDFARAVALHPLSPVMAPLMAGVLVRQAVAYVRTGAKFGTGPVPRPLELLAAMMALLLIAVWVARFFGFFGGPVDLH
jgi:hypothetical protein